MTHWIHVRAEGLRHAVSRWHCQLSQALSPWKTKGMSALVQCALSVTVVLLKSSLDAGKNRSVTEMTVTQKCPQMQQREEKRDKRGPVLTVMADEVGAQMSQLIMWPLESRALFERSCRSSFWNTVSDIGLYLLIQIKHFSNNKKEQVVPAVWQGNKGTKRSCCCCAEEIKSGLL